MERYRKNLNLFLEKDNETSIVLAIKHEPFLSTKFHILEHLLFPLEDKEMRSLGITSTGSSYLLGFTEVFYGSGRNMNRWAYYLSDKILRFQPSEELFEKEKNRCLREIYEMQDHPSRYLDLLCQSLMYEVKEDVKDLICTRVGEIFSLKEKYFSLPNLGILLKGEFERASIEKIAQALEQLPSEESAVYTELRGRCERNVKVQNNLCQAYLGIGFDLPKLYEKESPLNILVRGVLEDEIEMEIAHKKGLSYRVEVRYTNDVDASLFIIHIDTFPQEVNETLAALFNKIDKMKKEQISKRELDQKKVQAIREFRKWWRLGWDEHELLFQLYGIKIPSPKDVEKRIGETTAKEIQEYLARYICEDKACIVALTPTAVELRI